MVLLFNGERANPLQLRALPQIFLVSTPARHSMCWLRQTLRLEVDRLCQIPAMANVTVHGDVVLARDTSQVFLVRQRLQRTHTRPIQTAHNLRLVSFVDASLGASCA